MRLMVVGGARKSLFPIYSELKSAGHEVVVVDNLTKESFAGVSGEVKFVFADALDEVLLSRILKDTKPEAFIWDIDLALKGPSSEQTKCFELRHLGVLRSISLCLEHRVARVGFVQQETDSSSLQFIQQMQNEFLQASRDFSGKVFNSNSLEAACKTILI